MDGFAKLGIDIKSVVMYVVNFGILVFLLAKFLYRPTLKILDDRRNTISGNLKQAEELKEKFEAAMLEKEKEGQKMMQELKQKIEHAKEQAENQALQLRKQAEYERQEILKKTHEEIAVLKNELDKNFERELLDRISKILSFALRSNLPPETVIQNLKAAWKSQQKS